MRKRLVLLSMIISTLCASLVTPAYAELSRNFDSVKAEYGEEADSYITQTMLGETPVNVIYAKPEDATLYTLTNIRLGPSMETKSIGLVDVGDIVKVWGFTDNAWDKIYFKSADGVHYFGYIKGDLLIEPSQQGNVEEAPPAEGDGNAEG